MMTASTCSGGSGGWIRIIILLSLYFVLVLPTPASAQETETPEERPPEAQEEETMTQDLIDTEQSGTQRKYELEISLTPRLEDTVSEFFIRMPLRFKYGITSQWETSLALGFFVNNPTKEPSREGISDIIVGTKYRWKKLFGPSIHTATLFSVHIPTGHNDDINVGVYRYRPSIILGKTLKDWHEVELSGSVGVEIIGGTPEDGETVDDSLNLSVSALYPSPPLGYFFEAIWVTTEISGGGENSFFLTPGLGWDLRQKTEHTRLRSFKSFRLGARFGLGDADDDITIVARLKWDFPLKVKMNMERELPEDDSAPPGEPGKASTGAPSQGEEIGR